MMLISSFSTRITGTFSSNFVRSTLFRPLMMSTAMNGPDHLERTADRERENVKVSAIVHYIGNASPSVKHMQLKIEDSRFKFKAGQWLDFYPPGIIRCTGYSISCAPYEAAASQLTELAIKATEIDHPVTQWVHCECKKGDCVVVRAGGDCFYDPSSQEKWRQPHQLILIAGGIGINPMLSILKEALQNKNGLEKVVLLYSAVRSNELIFKNSIEELAKDTRMHFEVFVTQEPTTPDDNITCGRLSAADIRRNIENLGLEPEKTHSFLCGPGAMMDDMEGILIENGIQKDRIYYEKWW